MYGTAADSLFTHRAIQFCKMVFFEDDRAYLQVHRPLFGHLALLESQQFIDAIRGGRSRNTALRTR
jgi:hypothetical protein